MKQLLIFFLYASFSLLFISCKKDFLEAKRNKAMVVPQTLQDLQALLDNTQIMNTRMPSLGELGSDDYYLPYNTWLTYSTVRFRNAYIWAPDLYQGDQQVTEWDYRYQQIFYANSALEGIQKIIPDVSNQDQWNNIKGSALFFRSYAYYQLIQLFCKPYDSATAATESGIPLRFSTNINTPVFRSSIADTYNEMIAGFQQAIPLLPTTPLVKTRPSKAAAYAMLGKTYLLMAKFNKALQMADSCLSLYNTLLDYNSLNAAASFPLTRFNKEVIFHSVLFGDGLATRLTVDSLLYGSYQTNDWRKSVFYKLSSGRVSYKGSYDGSNTFFNGIATDEIFLIQAECHARLGNLSAALDAINTLLQKRYKTGQFTPITATSADEALPIIIAERRKELVFRGIRWSDLRRYNLLGANITLKRILNNDTYLLPPNDNRYVLPIPDAVIQLSGIPQNPR